MQGALIFAVLILVFFISSYLAIKSLKLLNFKVVAYYDFGKYLPGSNKWSTIVYIIIIAAILGVVLYFGRDQIANIIPA